MFTKCHYYARPLIPNPGNDSAKTKKRRGRHGMGEGGRSCWMVESTWNINLAWRFSTGITSR